MDTSRQSDQLINSDDGTKVLTSKDIQRGMYKDRNDEKNQNCCTRMMNWINSFIWRNEDELLKIDHLKAAPCVSTKFLAILRGTISLALIIQTTVTIMATDKHGTSFEFISQWNLIVITALFATMAIIEFKHTRRLNNFNVQVARNRGSFHSDGQTRSDHTSEEDDDDQKSFEQPWLFWKWLIPVYNAALCLSIVLCFSYWVTEATNEQFLLYIGSGDILAWDLLPTLPCLFLLIEFPFNMIPIDWPMLVFVELIFTLFMLFNFIVVSCRTDQIPIYAAFNWYHETGEAILYVFICYGLLAFVFSIFWAISQLWKLPTYAKRVEHKFERLQSIASVAQTLDGDDEDPDDKHFQTSIQAIPESESVVDSRKQSLMRQDSTDSITAAADVYKPKQFGLMQSQRKPGRQRSNSDAKDFGRPSAEPIYDLN